MTISQALKKYFRLEAEIFIQYILKKPKEFLYLHPEHQLNQNQGRRLKRLVERRLLGEPVAYILGYKDFCGLKFKVNKAVLIPRPETEELVDRIKNYVLGIKNTERKFSILDMGTGSGCVAVTLAKQLSSINFQFSITASDISEKALKVAKENANNILKSYSHTLEYGSKLKFVKSDLFGRIDGKFDLIVANLPYVPLKYLRKFTEDKNLSPTSPFSSLRFEPPHALTDGGSSYALYEKFFKQAPSFLEPNGIIFLEIDPPSKKRLKEWAEKYLPDFKTSFYKDFNGLHRFMAASSKK